MVTVDPGNLLVVGTNAPFMGLVNTGQPPAQERGQCSVLFKDDVNSLILKLYSAVVLFPAQLVATTLIV